MREDFSMASFGTIGLGTPNGAFGYVWSHEGDAGMHVAERMWLEEVRPEHIWRAVFFQSVPGPSARLTVTLVVSSCRSFAKSWISFRSLLISGIAPANVMANSTVVPE